MTQIWLQIPGIFFLSLLAVGSVQADSCTSTKSGDRERSYWNPYPAAIDEPGLGEVHVRAVFDLRQGEGLDRLCKNVRSDRGDLLKFECYNQPEAMVFEVTHVVYAPKGTLPPRQASLLSYQIKRYETLADRRSRAGYRVIQGSGTDLACIVSKLRKRPRKP